MEGREPALDLLGEDQRVIGAAVRSALRPVGGLLLVGGLLSGCTSDGPPEVEPSPAPRSSPAPSPAVAPEPPAEGRCYDLAYADSVAPTVEAEPVSCRSRHTSQTFLVGELDTVVDGHLLAVDAEQVTAQVARACPAGLADHVGGTAAQRRLSMIRAVWFTPTLEQSDDGHNWYRCDAVVIGGDEELQPVRGSLAGVLDTEAGRDRHGMCSTGKPGTRSFKRVPCASRHAWRAIDSLPLEPGSDGAWPGEESVRSAGEGWCKAAAGDRAEDPLQFTWSYEWPSREQWASGTRHGICWIPD